MFSIFAMQRLSFMHRLRVVTALGWSDFTLKYRGSVLGYLWSFLVPLVKFLVILHIFRPFASQIPFYPLYLFLGIILWEHFAMTTSACISLPHDKEAVIKKMPLPRILLVFSVGWMHCIILATYVIMFLLFSVAMGADLRAVALLYLPILFLQTTLLALGIGMMLGSYSLKFRDIPHLWGVLLQIFFWLTPVMYAYQPHAPVLADAQTLVSGGIPLTLWSWFDVFIRFQPLSLLMHDARRVLLYPGTLGIPSALHIGILTLILAVIFSAGVLVFLRRSPHFLEEY